MRRACSVTPPASSAPRRSSRPWPARPIPKSATWSRSAPRSSMPHEHAPSRVARTPASTSRIPRPSFSAGSCSALPRTGGSYPSPHRSRQRGDGGFAKGGNVSDADAAVGPLREAVAVALDEDLGVLGDLTSQAIIPEAAIGTGHFVARQQGVLAGTQAVDEVYRQLDPAVTVTWRLQDGDPVAAGHELGRVFGGMRSILSGERTALNFLCHLAGVATLTRAFVQAAGGGVRVLDTRKTLPGLR